MGAAHKILVVDDDAVVGKSFSRVLNTKGYAVVTASSGEEALEKMKTEKYDAVFTDIKMPGISGLELAEQVKATQPWMPVVIVTGYGSPGNELRAEAAGVSGFLRKPLTPDMIEASVERAVTFKQEVVEEAVNEVLPSTARSTAKNLALFFASPFIGLAYLLAMPAVMGGAMTYMAFKAAMKNDSIRSAVMLVAGPFIALGCLIAAPFAGLGALAYFAYKAATK